MTGASHVSAIRTNQAAHSGIDRRQVELFPLDPLCSYLKQQQSCSQQPDSSFGLGTRDLPIDVLRAIDERAQHLLHGCAGVGGQLIAGISSADSFNELQKFSSVAIKAGELVQVTGIKHFHCPPPSRRNGAGASTALAREAPVPGGRLGSAAPPLAGDKGERS